MEAAFTIKDPDGSYIETVQGVVVATKSSSYTNSPTTAVSPVPYRSYAAFTTAGTPDKKIINAQVNMDTLRNPLEIEGARTDI